MSSHKELVGNLTTHEIYHSSFTGAEETALLLILILTICLAFYGNVGMLIVLYKNDKMWNSTNILIGNLAFSGVLVSIISIPFHLTAILHSIWPYKEGTICKFNAFVNSELLLATIFTHTMISVDKYIGIVKPFSRAMTTKRTLIIIFLVWFCAAIMSIGPLAKLGSYTYNPSTLICGVGFPEKKMDSVYLLILCGVGFIIPNLVMGHAYIKVFMAVRKHTNRLERTCVASLDVFVLQKRLILTVFFSLISFLVCWSPFCIFVLMAIIVDSSNDIPRGLGISAYVCGYLYNVINPLIICSMSPRFHDGIIEVTKTILRLPFKLFIEHIHHCCVKNDYLKGNEDTWSNNTPTIQRRPSSMSTTYVPSTPTLIVRANVTSNL